MKRLKIIAAGKVQGAEELLNHFLAFLKNGPSTASQTEELVHYEIDVK